MSCRTKLEAYLHQHGVAFTEHQHGSAYTAQEVAHAEHVPGTMVAKVVVVFADRRLVMLVLPASHRISLEQAKAVLRPHSLRLADEAELEAAFPDCEVGAMPPFGNLYGLPVYVDRALTEDDTIVFQAGTHTDTLLIGYRDFARLVKPVVAQFAYLATSDFLAGPSRSSARERASSR